VGFFVSRHLGVVGCNIAVANKGVSVRKLIFLLPLFLFAQKSNVAILQFDAANISEAEVNILTGRLSTELVKLGSFTVVERSQMEEVLKEQGFQQSGCTTSECAVEVGGLLGVDKMITGSIGKIGSLFTLSSRLIDVETGEILRQVSFDVSGTIEEILTQTMAEIASQLSDFKLEIAEGFLEVKASRKTQKFDLYIADEVYTEIIFKKIKLPVGDYTYSIKEFGYADKTNTITIVDRETVTLTANNLPLMIQVKLQIYPQSSILMLNGNLLDANNFEVPFASSNELSIEAPKYIGTKESFIVNNTTEAIDFNIKLLPKSKNKAILNSLLFPGYGQFYYESKTKGFLFSITAASLTVLLRNTYNTYQDENYLFDQHQLDYRNATTTGDIESTWETYQNQANQVNDLQAQLLSYGVALGATWIINVVDALLFNGLKND